MRVRRLHHNPLIYILLIMLLFLTAFLTWLSDTDDPNVWPVRNTLHYRLLTGWWEIVGYPRIEGSGTMLGYVTDMNGNPIAGATVLIARWNGITFETQSDTEGNYLLEGIPTGAYKPIADAPGYEPGVLGTYYGGVDVVNGDTTTAHAELRPEGDPIIEPGSALEISAPTSLQCEAPVASNTLRRTVRFLTEGIPNQNTFLYTPAVASTNAHLPTLLAIYPGPADTWECTSMALAEAGYAVLAVGPAYSFDLEQDVNELEQLLLFARREELPQVDGERVAVLGGSYSAILAQRLLQRDLTLDAAVLLGPPTDLFDLRYRFEEGLFVPPFGLDRVLIALGFPDRDPMLYWRYSSIYHVRPEYPPIAIFHSYQDEVVPYQQSEQLSAALDAVGVEHELYLFDGATHYLLANDEEALEIYRLTLDFLEQYLGEP